MYNDKGYIALIYFILRSSFIGISSVSLINLVRQDAYLSILLGFILGFIPILLIYYISKYNNNYNINNTLDTLFPKLKYIIKIITVVIILFIVSVNFSNLVNLIYSQFLNRTPIIVISITLIIPIIMIINKSNKIITRVCFILFIISIFLIIISILGLINKFELDNIKPVLEYNPTKGIIPYLSYNVLPIYMALIFPGKYISKSIFKGYIISFVTLLTAMTLLIGILGVNLVILFQYPEFHILKLAYEGLISFRLENFLAIQWIIDFFVFTSIGIKFCNETINIKYKFILPIILILSNYYLFKNSTIANFLYTRYIPYIILILLPIIILIFIKIIIKKRNTITF